MSVSVSGSPPAGLKSKNQVHTRKRFQHPLLGAPSMILNEEGTIEEASPAALKMLNLPASITENMSFFSLVHGKNLYQVMRDVADMVCYGKAKASWLLRMRTGEGRWRWYKVTASCRDEDSERLIHVVLKDVDDW